uniref:Uncharacterized protein n=1 Tax=Octactis speculum TaxID=3111310 RepID=A0A7S2FN51_9STRA
MFVFVCGVTILSIAMKIKIENADERAQGSPEQKRSASGLSLLARLPELMNWPDGIVQAHNGSSILIACSGIHEHLRFYPSRDNDKSDFFRIIELKLGAHHASLEKV